MAEAISLSAARDLVIASAAKLESEMVPLELALGRTLSADLRSPISMPPFANSAMDGYALRSADTASAPLELKLRGESRAGTPSDRPLGEGEIARVSTGAAMPLGSDCILRIEDAVDAADGMIGVPAPIDVGHDVRPAGDDIEAGDLVIKSGSRIASGEVAMLAATGEASVECIRRPRVAIVTTGDELVPPGLPLGHGQIHDSNSAMLAALVAECSGELAWLSRGVVDDQAKTREAIDAALGAKGSPPDLLITCGGVSVGRHDHVKAALDDLGAEQHFWRVAMRPGHPTWFGTLGGQTIVLGLPGNPVSAWATFQMFAAPALRAMAGQSPRRRTITAKLGEAQRKPLGKSLVTRCHLQRDEAGDLIALPSSANQRSHAISSLVAVDGMAIFGPDDENPAAGSEVAVELISSEII